MRDVLQRQGVGGDGNGPLATRLHVPVECLEFFRVAILDADLDAVFVVITLRENGKRKEVNDLVILCRYEWTFINVVMIIVWAIQPASKLSIL